MIYLDNNASTPVDPEVSDAVFSSLRRKFGNPSSAHDTGKEARQFLGSCRDAVAALLGCGSDEVIFTSGGTESNNLAVLGRAGSIGKGHVITSVIEHPSVLLACRHLEQTGYSVTYVGVDREGIINLDQLSDAITGETILISVMHANNETGVIQPVDEIGRISRSHGIAFHTDAAQTIGKAPFSLSGSDIDMMTIAAHKCYGPKGIGALYRRRNLTLAPLLFGAGQEMGLRPGTENIAGIAGLTKALQLSARDGALRFAHTSHLSDLLLARLKTAFPDILLNGHKSRRLPNTLNVGFPGTLSHELVDKLKDRVALSTGSACHSGAHTPSTVLKAMGLSDTKALSSVRISTGKDNTVEEIEKAASEIIEAVSELMHRPSQTIRSPGA